MYGGCSGSCSTAVRALGLWRRLEREGGTRWRGQRAPVLEEGTTEQAVEDPGRGGDGGQGQQPGGGTVLRLYVCAASQFRWGCSPAARMQMTLLLGTSAPRSRWRRLLAAACTSSFDNHNRSIAAASCITAPSRYLCCALSALHALFHVSVAHMCPHSCAPSSMGLPCSTHSSGPKAPRSHTANVGPHTPVDFPVQTTASVHSAI